MQEIFKFDNGYGASVVQNEYSYGAKEGKFELAVIKFDGDEFNLCYDTPITDDVIGWLDMDEVQGLLKKIAALPSQEKTLTE